MEEEIIIRTENLVKEYGYGKNRFKAVDKVNIKVKKGHIHGFLGPNGAGKSTTIKMLVGAIKPTKGKAFIKNKKIGTVGAKQVLGYTPERPTFYKNMTSIEYLEYLGQVCGLNKKEASKKANELLDWLELKDSAHRNIGGFSAGMRQRLGLAQALIHDPELIILDEPTSNLDPIGRSILIDKIKQLAKEKNVTIFVSSHILPEIEKMADYVTIINHGKIILESDVGSLKHHFEGNHFILDCSNNKKIFSILKAKRYMTKIWMEEDKVNFVVSDEAAIKKELPTILASNNLALENFNKISYSLENIFMEVIEEEDGKT